jgi:hypothetical protein
MVEYSRARRAKNRNWFIEIFHWLLNLALTAAVFAAVVIFPATPWPALALVLLAKWRIFAVRPRYWWTNLIANLPDLLLGWGLATLMWWSGSFWVQIALSVFYLIWLVYIKPQHRHIWVLIQAGLAQFVAFNALFTVGYLLPIWVIVPIAFIIGFAVARQVLGLHEESAKTMLSTVWGIITALLSFAAWHWTVAYQIVPSLQIAQMTIIITVLGFITERAYDSFARNDGTVKWSDLQWPAIFAGAVLVVVLFVFGGLWGL